jgi:4a-hydroxytetrahydrobiopterin dehydratase
MHRDKLDDAALAASLQSLNAGSNAPWAMRDGKLQKTFWFNDFSEAFGFMAQVALAAERMNHHPEWCNLYKTVRVELSTYDAGGVTELDFQLAKRMDALAR